MLNWALIGNPVNWVIVFLMLTTAGLIVQYGVALATKEKE